MAIETFREADSYFEMHYESEVANSLKRMLRKNVAFALLYFDRRDEYYAHRVSSPKNITFAMMGRMQVALFNYGQHCGFYHAQIPRMRRFLLRKDSDSIHWPGLVSNVAVHIYESTPK